MRPRTLWASLGIHTAGLLSACVLPAGPRLVAGSVVAAGSLCLLIGLTGTRWGRVPSHLAASARWVLFGLLLLALGMVRAPDHWYLSAASSSWKVPGEGLRNPTFRRPLPLPPASTERDQAPDPPARLGQWASPGLRSLVAAIVLNRREGLPAEWLQAFRSTGTAHLLALSGLHVGILLAVFLGALTLVRLGPAVRVALAVPLLWIWIALVGFPPSAVRAGSMASLALVVLALGRPGEAGRILPMALLGIVLTAPVVLASVGFLLSAGAVTGIALAINSAPGRKHPRASGPGKQSLRNAGRLMVVSLGAQAGTLPAQILVFGSVAPMAPVLNLLVVPMMGLWLPAVLMAEAAHLIGGPLATWTGSLAEGLGRLLVWSVLCAAQGPLTLLPMARWSGWLAAAALGSWSAGGRWRLGALAAAAVVIWSPLLDDGRPRVTFLDVGQGDAAMIETGGRARTILVDAGPRLLSWDAGSAVIVPYLQSRGIRRLDVLLLTHPDGDHIGGARSVMEQVPVAMLVGGSWLADTEAGRRLCEGAAAQGTQVHIARRGDRVEGEGWCLEVLAGAESDSRGALSSNDRSLITRVEVGEARLLLPGDLERAGEARLHAHAGALTCEVLKISHHGSADATSDWLLREVSPRLAVFSVGARNRYGHPAQETLERVARSGAAVWRTDLQGALVVALRPDLERSVIGPIMRVHNNASRHDPKTDGQYHER